MPGIRLIVTMAGSAVVKLQHEIPVRNVTGQHLEERPSIAAPVVGGDQLDRKCGPGEVFLDLGSVLGRRRHEDVGHRSEGFDQAADLRKRVGLEHMQNYPERRPRSMLARDRGSDQCDADRLEVRISMLAIRLEIAPFCPIRSRRSRTRAARAQGVGPPSPAAREQASSGSPQASCSRGSRQSFPCAPCCPMRDKRLGKAVRGLRVAEAVVCDVTPVVHVRAHVGRRSLELGGQLTGIWRPPWSERRELDRSVETERRRLDSVDSLDVRKEELGPVLLEDALPPALSRRRARPGARRAGRRAATGGHRSADTWDRRDTSRSGR